MPEPGIILGVAKGSFDLLLKAVPFFRKKSSGLSVQVKQCEYVLTWSFDLLHLDVRPRQIPLNLHTDVIVRFENSDTISHLVKAISLVLFQKRWYWRRKLICESEVFAVSNSSHRGENVRLDAGLQVAPRALSDYYHLMFGNELPAGVSSLMNHTAEIRFRIIGGSPVKKRFAVNCRAPKDRYSFTDSVSGVGGQVYINGSSPI